MENDLKELAFEIAQRENIGFMTKGHIKKLSSEELFDFIQFYGHHKTKGLLKPKKFFSNTSTLLLNLIYEGKIDITIIARAELEERIGK